MARIKPSSTIAAATVYNNLSTIATLEINLIRQVPEALKIPVSDWAQNLWHCIFCAERQPASDRAPFVPFYTELFSLLIATVVQRLLVYGESDSRAKDHCTVFLRKALPLQ